MSSKIQQVKQFAVYVDKTKNGGNGNKFVDGSEIDIFKKKCKTIGIDNVDKIMEDYNNNRVTMESDYEAKGTLSNSSVETAVISAMTENTSLKVNDKAGKNASTIKEGMKASDDDWHWYNPLSWFNDTKELLNFSGMIDENNVLEVVNDDEILEKVVNASDETRENAGSQIISSLVAAAEAKQIDVSNIILEEDGKYLAGRDVEDVEFGSDATSSDNFVKVAAALRDAIKVGQNNAAGNDSNKIGMLTVLAAKIDSEEFGGNGNGYIDTEEEIEQFKQAAAKHGYDVNTVLEQIRDNDTNGVENTTDLQKTVFNIFDPEQRAARDAKEAGDAKNVSKAYKDGLANDNEELLAAAAGNVNSENVMQVLNDNPDLVSKLADKYDHNWFMNLFVDDTYQNYTSPILAALYQCAQDNGIEVDDIIMMSGDKLIVGAAVDGVKVGEDASDSDNVAKVVKALQDRINKEQA